MSDEGFDDYLKYVAEKLGGRKGENDVERIREKILSYKRVNEVQIDRLSDLPDSLIIHILSFLGVKGAAITSVLSKRWKCLWAELPRLEFCEKGGGEKANDFVSFVSRAIGVRRGGYLEKFVVKFSNYDKCFASDVDSWVEFLVKNGVKEVILMFYSCDYYELPEIMFSCKSLKDLHLTSVVVSGSTIKCQSLTRLSFDDVILNQGLIDAILSGCPVLNRLELEACSGFHRLEANSRCLDFLRVHKYVDELEISAPYVRDLDIKVVPQGRKWQLENISSVVEASVDFFDFFKFEDGFSEEVMSNGNEFLEKFKQVQKLYIGSQCFEVLSVMAWSGWQLPQFKLRDLTLVYCCDYALCISGIIAMLDSSPMLETLLLEDHETGETAINLDPPAKCDMDGDLLHLKSIRVNNFTNPIGEPLLTLAQILLRRAPALEEMTIVIDVEDTSDYVNIAETLLTYPRSSTKAKIHLSSRK